MNFEKLHSTSFWLFYGTFVNKMKLIAHREGVQPSDPLNKAYVDNIPGILVRPSILALFLFDQP